MKLQAILYLCQLQAWMYSYYIQFCGQQDICLITAVTAKHNRKISTHPVGILEAEYGITLDIWRATKLQWRVRQYHTHVHQPTFFQFCVQFTSFILIKADYCIQMTYRHQVTLANSDFASWMKEAAPSKILLLIFAYDPDFLKLPLVFEKYPLFHCTMNFCFISFMTLCTTVPSSL